MRLVFWIFGFLITALSAAIAAMNRQEVDLVLNPAAAPLHLPLYVPLSAALAGGFMIGAVCVWLNGGAVRQARRVQIRQIRDLEKSLQDTNEKYRKTLPPDDFFPSLTLGKPAAKGQKP